MQHATHRTLNLVRLMTIGLVLFVMIGVVSAGNDGSSALDFAGSAHVAITETISVSELGRLPSGFTLEAWIFPRTVTSHRFSIIRNNNDYNLYIDPTGHLVAEVFPGGTGTSSYFIETASTTLSTNQWYHVAAVSDTLGLRLYVNGGLANSSSSPATYTGPETLWIGNDQTFGTDGFDGAIDEVRIYTTSLTLDQIQATMFQTVAVTTTNLVGYWPFDEGGGTSTADASGNGNNGTLGGTLLPTWISSTAPLGSLDAAYQNDIAAMWAGQSNTAADGFATGLDIANVSFLNATGDDIIFGNNGFDFHSGITTNLSPTLNAEKRWARLWQLDVNDVGTTGGNVDLTFDISEAGGTGSFSQTLGNYYLLRRPTSSADDFAEATVVSSSVTGDRLTFRVDVGQLGSEFTVGADLTSPTAVSLQNLGARSVTDTPDIKLMGLVIALGLSVIGLVGYRLRQRTTH